MFKWAVTQDYVQFVLFILVVELCEFMKFDIKIACTIFVVCFIVTSTSASGLSSVWMCFAASKYFDEVVLNICFVTLIPFFFLQRILLSNFDLQIELFVDK
jgi:hypothetical protein